MPSSAVRRLIVLGYFGLLFLLSTLRGWMAYRAASTPVECTEGPCDAGVDYEALGMAAGAWGFMGAFFGGFLLFVIVWIAWKVLSRRKPASD